MDKLGGTILTKDGQDIIPFANILAEGTQIGTVSNQEGQFDLNTTKLGNKFTLIVSVIGFKTAHIKVNKAEKTTDLIIKLEENIIELDEVVFKYLSAEEVFENFHKNYTSNYFQGSLLTKAFYHSTLSENGEYKHLLEATIAIKEFTKKSIELLKLKLHNEESQMIID